MEPEDVMTTASPSGRTETGQIAPDPLNTTLAENWWAVAIRGILGIAFGLIALLFPGATILSLVIVFAAYLLVDGIFELISAVRAARRHERWGMLTFAGIVNIVTAVLAVLWPGLTVLAFVLMTAAWALVSGGLILAAAFRLNIQHGRWWLVLGGAASVVFGVLLFLAPLAGAIVLTWWLGAYALLFGVVLLILAFKLRSRRIHDQQRPALHAAA
jgi:uncharacterized membrane protein HdeD (DUF308 family)